MGGLWRRGCLFEGWGMGWRGLGGWISREFICGVRKRRPAIS
jgi:hypothetical protein